MSSLKTSLFVGLVSLMVLLLTGLLPLSVPRPNDSSNEDSIVFIVSPPGTKVWARASMESAGTESLLGDSGRPIATEEIRRLGSRFTLLFKKPGYKTLDRKFEGKQISALLSKNMFPSSEPLLLEPDSYSIALKERILTRASWSILSLLGLCASGYLFFRQQIVLGKAEALLNQKIRGGSDPYVGTGLGEYRLTRRLGEGGWGVVYEAVPEHLVAKANSEKQKVAIKLFKLTDPAFAAENRDRFINEGVVLQKLSHPNIIKFIEMGETEDDERTPYLVMEYLKGGSLNERLYAKKSKKVVENGETFYRDSKVYFDFTVKEIEKLMTPVVEALDHAHQHNVTHRDLTPANIFIEESGRIVVLDFGSGRLSHSEFTPTKQMMGTTAYAAPEVNLNARQADHRSDQFSLGVILYHMLTGKHPFGDTDADIWGACLSQSGPLPLDESADYYSTSLNRVFQRMLAHSKNERFDSISEAFQAFLSAVGQ